MLEAVKNTIEFFQPPKNYFWRWADNGDVLEWRDGTTICYRKELTDILKQPGITNIPSFSAMLLLLAPCLNEKYEDNFSRGILTGLLMTMPLSENDSSNEVMGYYIHQACEFMRMVSELPFELRRRQRFAHLLFEVFGKQNISMPERNFKALADELESGNLDELIFKEGEPVSRETFKKDLEHLSTAAQSFPNSYSLMLRLKAGIDHLPSPVEIIEPDDTPLDLFDQLAEDPQTSGMSRLAKHIIAALNIPMHSQGSGDFSFGGITDITNRGNYDKLLLSELAHDDLLLMARLVNNEALYFRREEPPDNPKRQRTILIDTTIKMWGVPRVFAVSAALACANNTKHNETVEAYTLGGSQFTEVHLNSKQGIIQALQQLDHALHCGEALQASVKELDGNSKNEFIFITDGALLNSSSFHASLAQVRETLTYILTVSRTGELQFFECIKGRLKSLSTAKFDLNELLFAKPAINKKAKYLTSEIDFSKLKTKGLYYPSAAIVPAEINIFYHQTIGAIGVTTNRRILYWPAKEKGTVEICVTESYGKCYFGFDGKEKVIIMQKKNDDESFISYEIIIRDKQCRQVTRYENKYTEADLDMMNRYYFIKTGLEKLSPPDLRYIKKYINNGYSVLLRINNIFINNHNQLCFDGHRLFVIDGRHIKFEKGIRKNDRQMIIAVKNEQEEMLPENDSIKLQTWVWPDGSKLIIDSRGLMYLKSFDENIPEVVIPLILDSVTACLSMDGKSCGSAYFLNTEESSFINAEEFYNRYIHSYIQRISEQ